MNEPPETLDGAYVVTFAFVTPMITPTGRTTHRIENQVLGPASALAIAQYRGSTEYYLFYCDSNWEVVTDTVHSSLREAAVQAAYEYTGISSQWRARSS